MEAERLVFLGEGWRVNGQWFCGVDGQQFGPFSWEQLRAMAAEGRLVADSFVRREVDQQWFTAGQIPGLLASGNPAAKKTAPQQPATVPSSAGAAGTKLRRAKVLEAVPAGQPVAVTPVAPVAVSAVAVGTPIAQGVVPVGFAPQPVLSSTTGERPAIQRKGSNAWLVVGILGGVCAVVAVGGIALVGWSLSRHSQVAADDSEENGPPITAAQLVAEVNNPVEANPAEANPAPLASAPGSASTAPTAAIATGKDSATSSESAAQTVITSQTKWSNILQIKAIKLNSVSLQISSAWLASDAAGTRVIPVLPGETAVPAATEATASEAEATPPEGASAEPPAAATEAPGLPAKFVFVEVKITNGSPVPKKYVSWNGVEATGVVLADQAGEVLAFVPPAATPTVSRQGTMQLAPGQVVTDVLVFTAPRQPVEMLKLALIKTALADAAKGHWAFEIPLEALFPKPVEQPKPMPVVAEAPAAAPPANTNGGQPGSISELNAQLKGPARSPDALPPATAPPPANPTTPPAAPMPDPNAPKKPPTAEELNKQFEELSKKPAEANPAAPKPPEPNGAK